MLNIVINYVCILDIFISINIGNFHKIKYCNDNYKNVIFEKKLNYINKNVNDDFEKYDSEWINLHLKLSK